jgi:hypothetical protein
MFRICVAQSCTSASLCLFFVDSAQQIVAEGLILHKGTLYEDRGPAVTKRSKYQRTRRMIRQLQQLGYRIESPNPQASQAQA